MQSLNPLRLLVVLAVMVGLANLSSAGMIDRIKGAVTDYHRVTLTFPSPPTTAKGLWQQIGNTISNFQAFTFRIPPIPVISNLWRTRNSTTTTTSSTTTSTTDTSSVEGSADSNAESIVVEAPSPSSAPASPFKNVGQNPDWCGGNILLDLTARRNVTYQSTKFPQPQSSPYACSWDVKVSRNCRRGRVTLIMDERSRLADDFRCSRGYFRVSPFMKEAKICGELGTLPPFQWYVDNTKYPPSDADVSVIMKNIGLNDGKDEGIAFTLSGECFSSVVSHQPNMEVDDVQLENVEASGRWMNAVLAESEASHRYNQAGLDEETDHKGPKVTLYAASMAFRPVSKLSSKASEKITQVNDDRILSVDVELPNNVQLIGADGKPKRKMTFFSPLYLLFRKFGIII